MAVCQPSAQLSLLLRQLLLTPDIYHNHVRPKLVKSMNNVYMERVVQMLWHNEHCLTKHWPVHQHEPLVRETRLLFCIAVMNNCSYFAVWITRKTTCFVCLGIHPFSSIRTWYSILHWMKILAFMLALAFLTKDIEKWSVLSKNILRRHGWLRRYRVYFGLHVENCGRSI